MLMTSHAQFPEGQGFIMSGVRGWNNNPFVVLVVTSVCIGVCLSVCIGACVGLGGLCLKLPVLYYAGSSWKYNSEEAV